MISSLNMMVVQNLAQNIIYPIWLLFTDMKIVVKVKVTDM